ncbi:hypothetical protein [Thalassospira xiamenensis]|uniref:hypothetical protein n=1 Tax=Thalassospira xiamenensis TaxID=220697 RepID=UPI00115D078A|nr:hypothetical protein [Thalassospira xiamenensis]
MEICAGNGYFASLLAEQGVTITPTSLFTGHDGHSERMYCPVEELDAEVAVDLHGDAHDVLLCSWPTTNNAMVRAATKWGTDRDIVFIGEFTDYTKGHLGGCATDDFFANINVISDFLSYEARLIERAIVVRWRDAAHTD